MKALPYITIFPPTSLLGDSDIEFIATTLICKK